MAMNPKKLVLCENMRAVPYVPFYLALAGGYWATEGLAIEHVLSPATTNTPLMLLEGKADVSWGGPMRVMMHHDADPACPLVCFGQVVARDPFVLVGHGRRSRFRFGDLAGLKLAPAGDVPTPWMCFQDDLQRAGLDPRALAGRRVRPMKRNIRAYLRGEVDVVQVFEPYAQQLVESGHGTIWHRFAERGDIAYTTFYATRAMTESRRDECARLVTGIGRALAALARSRADTVAQAIAGFLPDTPVEQLGRIIEQYRASGLWARSPELPTSPFLRLKAALVSGGLISTDPSYARVIDRDLSAVR
jgi:NitT/TauT family transport system substrate-binding protein